MNNLKNDINKIISKQPSNWKEKAKLRKNSPWLREYSSEIARRILASIEKNEELNQTKLAELLSVSSQQVSKIVQGHENLTLETIYKISKALRIQLITFPEYKYSSIGQSYSITPKELPPYFMEMKVMKGGGVSYDNVQNDSQKVAS